MLSWLRPRRRRGERGAVAVEAALVTPVILILVFGIIEFSFALRDYVAVSSAVRVGARIGSANAGAGPGDCPSAGPDLPSPPVCTPATAPKFAQQAADAIQRAGSAMPKDQIDYIYVFKANDKGYPGADGVTTMPASPAACAAVGNCVVYRWRAATDKFRYDTGTWTSSQVDACVTTGHAIGVYLKTTHKFMTGFFGQTIVLADHAVMKFEPLGTATCAPGRHL
jgi:hypothetical protein